MKIENQCCLLKQAKKLNELGIVQGCSVFYFDITISNTSILYNEFNSDDIEFYDAISCFSAFNVAELGIMLGRFCRNTASLSDNGNEASDRAHDLIHLLEIGELLVDSCNERLKNS